MWISAGDLTSWETPTSLWHRFEGTQGELFNAWCAQGSKFCHRCLLWDLRKQKASMLALTWPLGPSKNAIQLQSPDVEGWQLADWQGRFSQNYCQSSRSLFHRHVLAPQKKGPQMRTFQATQTWCNCSFWYLHGEDSLDSCLRSVRQNSWLHARFLSWLHCLPPWFKQKASILSCQALLLRGRQGKSKPFGPLVAHPPAEAQALGRVGRSMAGRRLRLWHAASLRAPLYLPFFYAKYTSATDPSLIFCPFQFVRISSNLSRDRLTTLSFHVQEPCEYLSADFQIKAWTLKNLTFMHSANMQEVKPKTATSYVSSL